MHELARHALEARKRAYAPYSGYAVGACVLGGNGKLYTGCNIENVSYGVTLCAERVALGQMVSDGCRELLEIAVATADGGTPCGMCLQMMAEFALEMSHVSVHCVTALGHVQTHALRDLLPFGFSSSEVRQNDPEPGESE